MNTVYRHEPPKRNPDHYFKFDEIEEHFKDFLEDHSFDFLREYYQDLHHYAYNMEYYIIGTYKAEQWLGDRAFEAIRIIQDYENDNFGNVTTDLSDPEKIVNMYTYIVGERVIYEFENLGKLDYINPEIKSVPDGLIGNPA